MKKAILISIAILALLTAAGFFALRSFSGNSIKKENPAPEKAKDPSIEKLLREDGETRTGREVLDSIRNIGPASDDRPQSPTRKKDDDRPDESDREATDKTGKEAADTDEGTDRIFVERSGTVPEPAEDTNGNDPAGSDTGDRYEISREKYEECGHETDRILIRYSDGSYEIVDPE